jgi:hypothetical protein
MIIKGMSGATVKGGSINSLTLAAIVVAVSVNLGILVLCIKGFVLPVRVCYALPFKSLESKVMVGMVSTRFSLKLLGMSVLRVDAELVQRRGEAAWRGQTQAHHEI